ncbi:MAG: CheR family methyltransferase [Steroidobacteraceae bacterium]
MKTAAAKIEALLQHTMGLDAASIGSSTVERAIRTRLAACHAATIADYWDRMKDSSAELQALIEVVVVPETWFSRDAQAFAELTRVARDEWRPNRPAAVRHLLSLPCSTGEEPYSMAMAMLDADCPPGRFVIDAVDISERALEQARQGIYGKHSFRGVDLAFRDRYFEAVNGGHRVHDAVRRGVRFRQGNVLDNDFLADADPYDAIFCRNLLIYFDEATQDRTIAKLRELLTENGLLFVGPAESHIVLDHDFEPAKVPMAFAFRRCSPRRAQPVPLSVPTPAAPPAKPLSEKPAPIQKCQPLPPPAAPDLMEEAASLANQGRLAEAETLCEDQMRKHGPSAAVFHLMGLICSADGRTSVADRYYRKALYLDQNHHDALVHLSLLLEQQGDARGAQLLRSRAQKV